MSDGKLRQRAPRLLDPSFLAFLRQKPCCFCGSRIAVQAAHLRAACARIGKSHTGMQEKPDDRWALPLCSWCHLDGPQSQHRIGEEKFWALAGIDPFDRSQELYREYGGTGGRPTRRRTIIKPRLPKHLRKAIPRRKDPWGKSRPLKSS